MTTKENLKGKFHKRQLVFSGKTMPVDYTCALCLSTVDPLEGCSHCNRVAIKQRENAQAFFEAKRKEKELLSDGLPKRKRGRPRKHPLVDLSAPKRPRGRPKGSKNKKGG